MNYQDPIPHVSPDPSEAEARKWFVRRTNGEIEDGWEEVSRSVPEQGGETFVELSKMIEGERRTKTTTLSALEELDRSQKASAVGQGALQHAIQDPQLAVNRVDVASPVGPNGEASLSPDISEVQRQISFSIIAELGQVKEALSDSHGQLSPRTIDAATLLLNKVSVLFERSSGVDRSLEVNAATLSSVSLIKSLLSEQRQNVSYGMPDYRLQDKIIAIIDDLATRHHSLFDVSNG